jgi:hypothetical protein
VAEPLDDDDPMNPAAWYQEPNVCGSCIAWRPDDPRPGEDVAAGACKLRPELGRVPASLAKCNIYKPRGQFTYTPGTTPTVRRRKTGQAKVLRRSAEGDLVPSRPPPRTGLKVIDYDRLDDEEVVVERLEPDEEGSTEDWSTEEGSTEPRPPRPEVQAPKTIDLGGDESAAALKQGLTDMIRTEHGRSNREIHSKYRTGGKAIAATKDGAKVEISAERLFSFLVKLRASLDALEIRIERTQLEKADKEEMVANVKRMHGSMTTFNLMFQDKEDYFSGKE